MLLLHPYSRCINIRQILSCRKWDFEWNHIYSFFIVDIILIIICVLTSPTTSNLLASSEVLVKLPWWSRESSSLEGLFTPSSSSKKMLTSLATVKKKIKTYVQIHSSQMNAECNTLSVIPLFSSGVSMMLSLKSPDEHWWRFRISQYLSDK